RYRLEIVEVAPDGGEKFVFRLSATTHGEVVTECSRRFEVGKRYKARIYWEGSTKEKPDYDWCGRRVEAARIRPFSTHRPHYWAAITSSFFGDDSSIRNGLFIRAVD